MTTKSGFDEDRLANLRAIVEADVSRGRYFGTSIKVARAGELVLDLAVGHADSGGNQPIATDTVFSILSVTKAFINVLILRAIELGRIALTTRMAEIIPEYSGAPRDRATIFHFLTHTTGVPAMWEMRPGMYFDDLDEIVAAVCQVALGSSEPGSRCDYSPMANHVLLAEVLRRIDPDKRPIGEILQGDLFGPLRMVDTGLGIRAHMRERHAVPDMRGTIPVKALSRLVPGDNGLYEADRNEATWMGAASTTGDLFRFARMLRNGGELDGARILSPRTIELARRNWTGELPNELYKAVALRNGYAVPPAYLGFGFSVRGEALVRHQFGTLTSSTTFGNYGAGSSMYWIDPELDITFVGLSAGLLPQAENIERFQQLSDAVVGAAI
ncbi:serine hydrolase domain-containing protein [Diaminobutyricibacter sp. McL0618]|uniref:serine hydrolase domain-containing protein n=1 Tax=Leifsonia sp. McL0618 TaxID=3415677 RepID=UPI003CF0AED6